jgi:mono/diheme cytochrome c family protein
VRRAPRVLAVIVLIGGACGGDSSPSSSSLSAAATAAPAAAPASGIPTGSLRGDAAAGAQLYSTYCASCHGPDGKGDGPVAASLEPPPANHADHVYIGGLSDEHLYKVISQGGAAVGKSPLMAPWAGVVNDEGIRDLIAFIRKLSST